MGEPRRLRHERERRAAADAARARRDGLRPRGVPRPAARLQPVERHHSSCASGSPRSIPAPRIEHIEVTNGTSEANYLVALSQLRAGDVVRDGSAQLHADARRGAEPGRRGADLSSAAGAATGSRTGTSSSARSQHARGFSTSRTRTTRLDRSSPTPRWSGSSARCEATGTWLLSDEVYLGAEIDRPRTKSFWGMSDRVIVTSGLSKAYGIPGVRIGWIVAPGVIWPNSAGPSTTT